MRSRGRLLYLFPLVALAAFYLLPVYVLTITGLKSFAEVDLSRMWQFPSGLHFDSFRAAFEALRPHLRNSAVMAVPAATISALLGSMNGYVLSKWRFRGANVIFTLFLFGMFIPYQSVLIPLVLFLRRIGLYGSIPGLILVHVVYGIPITTLIFRNYYATVPTDLLEAARIDGAGILRSYWYIILRLSAPSFAVALIWQFTSIWNEFLFAIILTKPSNWPVTVALNNLAGTQIVQWNVQMAGALLAAVPTLIVYIFLGRFFLRGLMAGAIKG
jgi:glucose/mannose transport system permease protein